MPLDFLKQTKNSFLLTCLLLLIAVTPVFAQTDFGGGGDTEPIVTISSVFSSSEAEVGKAYDAALIVHILDHWHINSDAPLQDFLIPAKLTSGEFTDYTILDVNYPSASTINVGGSDMLVYSNKAVVKFKVLINEKYNGSTIDIPLSFSFQPCDDKTCVAPDELTQNLKIKIGSNGTALNQELFAAQTTQTKTEVIVEEADPIVSAEANELQQIIDENGFWGYFLVLGIAFITGLLLSF